MLRSMYSGISGMKANQTKMDVVGNNVANVGTTAFKKSTTRFSDSLNQTMIYASAPGGGLGGVNPGQVGIGTQVSGIFNNMLQGSIQPTGRATDVAIDGDGFFTLDLGDGRIGYTRDGSFSLDRDGYLVTAEGYRVLNDKGEPIIIPDAVDVPDEELGAGTVPVDEDGKVILPAEDGEESGDEGDDRVISFTINKDGSISYLRADGITVDSGDKLQIAMFKNPEGLEALGGNVYGRTANSGDPIYDGAHGLIHQGAIEMSNVDLSEEFTEMIVTTRAFQAASKVITTSDELLNEIINLKR